jgi:CheY-like chemotaxis protein
MRTHVGLRSSSRASPPRLLRAWIAVDDELHPHPPDAIDPPPSTPQEGAATGRRSILIVEDDPVTLEQFASLLTLEGYTVHTAADAASALQIVQRTPPDAILLDLHLPIIDGLQFLRHLRGLEQDRRTSVAIVTGDYFIDEAQQAELKSLGAALWFKPVWLDDLARLVSGLLSSSA